MSRGRRNARRGVCHICQQLVTINFRTGLYAEHDRRDGLVVTCPASGTPSGIAPAKPAPALHMPLRRPRTSRREISLQGIAELARKHLDTLDVIGEYIRERHRNGVTQHSLGCTTCHPLTKAERDWLLALETVRAHADRDLREALADHAKRFP